MIFQQGSGNRRIDGIRGKVFNYFNFAIVGGNTNYKDLGECSDVCSSWKQKCCASMVMSRGDTREFQYACINNGLGSGSGTTFELADIQVQIRCNDVYAGAQVLTTMIGAIVIGFASYI